VSLDYSHTPSNSWDAYRKNVFWTEDFASHVDATICLAVNQVARGCPVLKTLTLHIFSFPAFVHLVALAAHDQCATTAALSGLVDKLDKLTIVGMAVEYQYGPHQVLCPREKVNDTISRGTPLYNSEYAFLTSIAPWSRWNHGPDPRRGLSWPGLKVNDDFISHDEKARGNEPFKLYEYQEEKYDRRTHQLFRKSEQIWHLMRIVDDEAVDGF